MTDASQNQDWHPSLAVLHALLDVHTWLLAMERPMDVVTTMTERAGQASTQAKAGALLALGKLVEALLGTPQPEAEPRPTIDAFEKQLAETKFPWQVADWRSTPAVTRAAVLDMLLYPEEVAVIPPEHPDQYDAESAKKKALSIAAALLSYVARKDDL